MAEQIPINPALLIWARQRAGLSPEEVAQKFKRIADWEAGASAPTYPQLEQLSDALKVPIAVFFFPGPPDVPPINETFRTLPEAELDRLPSRVRILMRKAKAMQINLAELTQSRNPAKRLITRDLQFAPNVDIAQMAAAVRQYIGVTVQQQQAWHSDDAALKEWRTALLNVGVFVFKDAFRADDFSGFCLYDDEFPVIYVNNSSTKTRQIFTYFHELAHLIFHTSGIDMVRDRYVNRLVGDARQIEVICNSFAAQVLVPEDAFQRAMVGRQDTEVTAEALAAQFHVSREVIFRRLLDQGRVAEDQYDQAVERWNAQRQVERAPGGNPYWTKLAYLGREYVALALSQYHQNKIDEGQLADFLDTKPRHVGALEEYFSRGAS
ncbi:MULTISPECIES: XRE family transcriptional regulator [unclassified Mesorhizobium]|uniref:helix-turn-helix domain-containing protein n=1 Tax=unclassified Mesorhizobium TaxID=325217 RepID=UPI0003CEEEF2|nr:MULTISPECIES: XRE family transcriptional regulator [unclassified Mesorhizobium]ESX29893.1 DNA-binding protein [Mesorhizobium sp. LSHC440B00]ESX35181.1 DNA-binding protein [Mesorhizobium sp. LSHC432A00]ESX41396.1 DNA-binding protein [Mesorhizobium sp. LSHC440A00]WJI55109.1 XRE family transcriptional regulator [Mesorhizobium sp. C432A]